MSNKGDTGKSYHLQCTGDALKTSQAHSEPADLTLYAGCFCPFVQRAWVALEYLRIDYHVLEYLPPTGIQLTLSSITIDEVDPYKKPAELLEVSPKGLVPALKLNNTSPPRAINESVVNPGIFGGHSIAVSQGKGSLLPPISDPYARALVRLQADHVNRALVPAFYRYLQAQDEEKQIEGGKEFVAAIEGLVNLFERAAAETDSDVGLWKAGGTLSLADVMAGPWLFRATNVLVHYRGFALPEGQRFRAYVARLVDYPAFKATCSTEQLYLDSYERYAYNRPNTSQVANAINSGRGLP